MTNAHSNSNDRRPHGEWLRTWMLGLCLAIAGLAMAEWYARSVGQTPSLTDDRALWATQREQLCRAPAHTIVLLGASKIQVGIDPQIVRETTGCAVVNLAINGKDAVATLRDIAANEPEFRGIILFSTTAEGLRRAHWRAQQPWVEFHHREWGLNARLNRIIRSAVQSQFATADPAMSVPRIVPAWLRGEPPTPNHIQTRADRFQAADFTQATHLDARHQRYERGVQAADQAAWKAAHEAALQDFREVAEVAARIEARGARVVFLRLPSSGPLARYEEIVTPRMHFWDAFAAMTEATTIHFADVPELRGIEPPDGSHVDIRDVPAHTRAWVRELQRRGVLPTVGADSHQ